MIGRQFDLGLSGVERFDSVTTINGKPVTLINVVYIPSYAAKVVTATILRAKGLSIILRRQQFFCKVQSSHSGFMETTPAISVITSAAPVAEGVKNTTTPNSAVEKLAKQHQEELALLVDHWQRRQAWQQKNEKLKQLHPIEFGKSWPNLIKTIAASFTYSNRRSRRCRHEFLHFLKLQHGIKLRRHRQPPLRHQHPHSISSLGYHLHRTRLFWHPNQLKKHRRTQHS